MNLNRMLASVLALGLVTGAAYAGESKRVDGSHDSRSGSGKHSQRSDKDTGLDNAEDRGSDRGQERKESGMDQAQDHDDAPHDGHGKHDRRHGDHSDSSHKH